MRRWIDDEGKPMRDIVLGKSDHAPDLAAAWSAADKVGTYAGRKALPLLRKGDAAERFWAIVAMRQQAGEDARLQAKVAEYLDDVSPAVRIEAAGWLAHAPTHREAALKRLVSDLDHDDWAVALHACRSIELLGEQARSVLPTMRALYDRTRHAKGDNHFFLAFSSGAFLEKLGEKTEPWDFTPGAGSFMPAKKKD
jgi:aminopeptidase N